MLMTRPVNPATTGSTPPASTSPVTTCRMSISAPSAPAPRGPLEAEKAGSEAGENGRAEAAPITNLHPRPCSRLRLLVVVVVVLELVEGVRQAVGERIVRAVHWGTNHADPSSLNE